MAINSFHAEDNKAVLVSPPGRSQKRATIKTQENTEQSTAKSTSAKVSGPERRRVNEAKDTFRRTGSSSSGKTKLIRFRY